MLFTVFKQFYSCIKKVWLNRIIVRGKEKNYTFTLMNVLEIQNISKSYGDNKALDNVSISIPEGSIFGLLGPNGAGKTTLLRILNQIIIKDEGTLLLNGESLKREHVRKLGYMPEERGLYKKMKVGKQIEYFARLKGISRTEAAKRSNEWLTKLELMECKNKRTMELSKGMQQKVQFIITVIHNPAIIILDEPFSGFDPVNAQLIKQEILKLKENGMTILLSSHRMENVEEICDHVAMLNKSKKVLDGTIRELKQKFKGDLYKIKSSTEIPESSLYDIVKSEKTEDHYEQDLKLNASSKSVLKELLEITEISHLEEVIPSLEEIFFNVVKEENHV